jgi:hypothetical protein
MAEKSRQLKSGLLEFYDDVTGEVLSRQKTSKKNIKRIAEGKKPIPQKALNYRWKKNKNGKYLLVRGDMIADDLPDTYELVKHSRELCLDIAEHVAAGWTFERIAKIEGFPVEKTMFLWMLKDPEFRDMINEARKVRAESYHDKLFELSEKVKENTSRSARVKADILKHLMSVNDRDRFGAQTKVVGDPNAPVSFIVDTGIRRSVEQIEDNPLEAESSVIEEVPVDEEKDS